VSGVADDVAGADVGLWDPDWGSDSISPPQATTSSTRINPANRRDGRKRTAAISINYNARLRHAGMDLRDEL